MLRILLKRKSVKVSEVCEIVILITLIGKRKIFIEVNYVNSAIRIISKIHGIVRVEVNNDYNYLVNLFANYNIVVSDFYLKNDSRGMGVKE